MKTIEQKVIKFIDSEELINKGDRILLAFSGGPDSQFLLAFLQKYKQRYGIEFAAFHVNHLHRGKEGDDDENFCRQFCEREEIKLYINKAEVNKYSDEHKVSIEEAGRDLRYSAFEKCAKENNYSKIATAHTIDDNAETVLFRLFKGTGLAGISGIPIVRDNIIRPILCVNKNEILEYLNENGIKYRLDPSNFKNDYQRNIIRNEILPEVRKVLNPSVNEALFRSSIIFRENAKLLSNYVEREAENFIHFENEKLSLDLDILELHSSFLFSEILKLVIQKYFGHHFNFDDYSKLKDLIKRQTGKKVMLSESLEVMRERNELLIYRSDSQNKTDDIVVNAGKQISVGSNTLVVNEIDQPQQIEFEDSKYIEFVCADELDNNFILRRWRDGDKFQPLGMNNFKKVSDFLNEQHVPASEKKDQLVLLNRNNIVWIVGLRIDDRYKLTDKSKTAFKLWMKKNKN